MKVTALALPEVLLIEPRVFADDRGCFFEAFSDSRYAEAGIVGPFVQDNVSCSRRGVLRGLHYQHPHSQGKLVSVLKGEVFDVAVDIRLGSPTFGGWVGELLSEENRRQLWIPPGFAHGFQVLSDDAVFAYKCTEYYRPEHDRSLRWDDPAIGIQWPGTGATLSRKDADAPTLEALEAGALPVFAGSAAREKKMVVTSG